MLKRIISVILAVVMLPVLSAYAVSAQESAYDASIFGDNAEYLLEEHFSEAFIFQMDGLNYRRPSGWDVDYRGGQINTSGYALQLNDASTTEEISLKREIVPVTDGEVVFETAMSFSSAANAEFSVYLGDEENYILHLFFNNQSVYNVTEDGKTKLCGLKAHQPVYVKALVSMDNQDVYLQIENLADGSHNIYDGTVDFANNVSEFRDLSFHTGKKSAITTKLHYANVYRNFLVNERFMSTPLGEVPMGFTVSPEGSDSAVADAPGSTYKDDENGFLLKNTAENPKVELATAFVNTNEKTTVSWTMLMPEIQNGFYARIATNTKPVATIYTGGGKLFANGQQADAGLTANLWYTISADIDTSAGTYDLMVNKRTVLTDIPLYNAEAPTKLTFTKESNGTVGEMLVDDIVVAPTFEKYADYPTAPTAATSDGVSTGMIMYPMWREGIHYGWDTISPYADERKPYMGYYTEGQVEVSDWQNKWMIEHGIDYAIYPFVRPTEYKVNEAMVGEPIKSPVRGEDLMDGYMNSFYKDDIKFAIMLSQWDSRYKDANDFVTYAVPYIKEYFFKNPNYMVINNKLPIYCYSIGQMSNAFGGTAGMQTVLDALDAAAREVGYAGIIFGADAASSNGHTAVNNINRDYVRIWNYTETVGDVGVLKLHIDKEYANSASYIPSISVGYDDTPWRASRSEMMSAGDVEELCSYVKNHTAYKAEDEKMVVFTCWNEYGEGHFFSPSTKEGFGYLNAIRSVFTSAGKKSNEDTPSAKSIARMEAFYPNGRGALKVLNDKEYSATDIASREVLYKYTFDSSSGSDGWFTNNCNVSYSNSGVTGTATSTNPWIQCEFGNIGVPISDVRALKIRMYQTGGNNMQVFYHTDDYDADPSIANQWGEFFTTEAISGTDKYTDYILHFNSQAGDMTGNISMIRLRFADSIYSMGSKKFGVQSFELLGDPKTVEPIARIEFDTPDAAANCDVQEKDGALFCEASANDPQLRYTSVSETVDMSKVKAIKIKAFTQGTNELRMYYTTNGNVTYQHSPYKFTTNSVLGDGSYRIYTLTHDSLGSNAAPTGNLASMRIDPADNIYENGKYFGIDWIEFYDQETYDATYPITMTVEGQDMRLTSPIQVKNGEAFIPIYSILLDEIRAYVVWDEPTKTLSVEKNGKTLDVTAGSNVAVVNGKEIEWDNTPFYEKGNLFVPCDEFFAALGYAADYNDLAKTVTCTKEPEQAFKTSVTEVGYFENIAPGFWDSSTQANDYFINGSSITGSNLSDITVTMANGEDAIKITPPKGAGNDALFVCRFVNYKDEYMTLKNFVSKGTKMKVSFSYKGVGTAVEVESREDGGGNTQKAPAQTVSSTEWQTFEYEFDNSKIPITDKSRWLAIRFKSASGTDAHLYVKDFVISYPEEQNVTEYSGGILKIAVQTPTGSRTDIPYTCYVAEYDDNCLVKIATAKKGNASDAGDYITYYNYTPTKGDRVKIFLWNGVDPLYDMIELTKK